MGRGRASRLAAGHWCCESRGPSVIGAPTGTNCSWLVLTRCLTRRGQAARCGGEGRLRTGAMPAQRGAGVEANGRAAMARRLVRCALVARENVRIDAPAEEDNEFSALKCGHAGLCGVI